MTDEHRNICIVSDGTDSIIQSRELALHLTHPEKITKIYKDEPFAFDPWPDLAIGVGFNVTETLVKMKEQSGGQTRIAIILDPLAHYDKFDFIILPSYEPYKIKGDNVIRTTGLITFVNSKFLNLMKMKYDIQERFVTMRKSKLKPPFLAVLVGGRHTGGNVDVEDAKLLAEKINQLVKATDGTALITTSQRTEIPTTEALEDGLYVPYFLYNYKKREMENPYGAFLTFADEIIVTGESVRMLSEACSTGKPVRIFCPRQYGFQYKPLIDELITGGHAYDFSADKTGPVKKLDEAGRVAELILKKL